MGSVVVVSTSVEAVVGSAVVVVFSFEFSDGEEPVCVSKAGGVEAPASCFSSSCLSFSIPSGAPGKRSARVS